MNFTLSILLPMTLMLVGCASSYSKNQNNRDPASTSNVSAEEAEVVTLKDCENLSTELYYNMPPPIGGNSNEYRNRVAQYEERKGICNQLHKQVDCSKNARESRSEAIFFSVVRKGQLNTSTADFVTAELICSRR
jgi:hypothetical protein